jgi:hypothetical protein
MGLVKELCASQTLGRVLRIDTKLEEKELSELVQCRDNPLTHPFLCFKPYACRVGKDTV